MSNNSSTTSKVWIAPANDETAIASKGYRGVTKRVLDLVLAVLLLPTLIPVIAVLYVLVRLDGGPGFFGHKRVGRNNQEFRCWKVRTMVVDAQERLDALLASSPEARAEWERDQKLRNDPRVTRLGNFLRKTSLDELPQIWNVIKGEMSLVGPRPVTRSEMSRYGGYAWAYQALRPGITGLWQVSGRNDVSYDERVELDVRYLNEMSLASDISILMRTGKVILDKTGC